MTICCLVSKGWLSLVGQPSVVGKDHGSLTVGEISGIIK